MTLVVRREGTVVARVRQFARAGRNTIAWNGRFAHLGQYTLVLEAVDGGDQAQGASVRIVRKLR